MSQKRESLHSRADERRKPPPRHTFFVFSSAFPRVSRALREAKPEADRGSNTKHRQHTVLETQPLLSLLFASSPLFPTGINPLSPPGSPHPAAYYDYYYHSTHAQRTMFFGGGDPFEHFHGGHGRARGGGGSRGGGNVDTTKLYETLGVPKTATGQEIKKAYRKLAVKVRTKCWPVMTFARKKGRARGRCSCWPAAFLQKWREVDESRDVWSLRLFTLL